MTSTNGERASTISKTEKGSQFIAQPRVAMRMPLLRALVLLSSAKAISADLLSSQHAFADSLTPILYNSNNSTNDCSSALGVSMAFGLVYPSMIDLAQEETASVFGFTSDNMKIQWVETERTLEGTNDGSCVIDTNKPPCTQYPTVWISNSVWLNAALAVSQEYSSVVKDYVKEIDFAATDAGNLVNAWVNQSTNGLIDSIVDNGPLAGVPLIAINTIYLKADWAKPFSDDFTSQDVFYASPARETVQTSTALFLHALDYMAYTQTDTHQILSLPFSSKNGASPLSMVIALPLVEDAPMVQAQELVDGDLLLSLESTPVALALPKFEFRSEYSDTLKSALQTIGLDTPFRTGLCIYDDDCTTAVDRIIQKTFISLNEQGVEAAAVTAIVGRNFPFYPDNSTLMLVDHPFQFFIHDEDSGVVLFEGRVVLPEAEGVKPTTNHTTSLYWQNQFGVTTVNRVAVVPETTDTPIDSMTTAPIPGPLDTGSVTTTTAPVMMMATTTAPVAMVVPTTAPVAMVLPTTAPVVSTNAPTAAPSTLPTQSPQETAAQQVDTPRSPAVRSFEMLMTLGAIFVLLIFA